MPNFLQVHRLPYQAKNGPNPSSHIVNQNLAGAPLLHHIAAAMPLTPSSLRDDQDRSVEARGHAGRRCLDGNPKKGY